MAIRAYVRVSDLRLTPEQQADLAKGGPITLLPAVEGISWVLADRDAAIREEGRREILREIAEKDCAEWSDNWNCEGGCFFCSTDWPQGPQCRSADEKLKAELHKPDCLWLRAKAVSEPA